jgi:hypothetical protein
MADFVFNIAKGRVVELYNRVKGNDPANSALIMVVLATSGLESDATLKDKDTLADVVSGATNEVTNTNYARKTLTDADLAALPSPDDANDRYEVDIPDQTFSSIAAGDGWSKVLICYDPDTTGGTDANIVPLCAYDFVITPDGSNIVVTIHANGFFRAGE